MNKSKKVFLVVMIAMGLMAAACSSSSGSNGNSGGTGGGGKTITIGLLTDLTGPAASSNKTSVQGVEAGVHYAKDHGYNIKYVTVDSQTSATGVVSAAQQLVEQDHVLAVVAVSSLTFLASKFLSQNHVPVVGAAEDASEWVSATNMFPATGRLDVSKVATTAGKFFEMEGVTNLASLGYGVSPQSSDAAESAAVSAQYAGLRTGYVNANFSFGSTNVQPIALAMQSAGVDGVTASVDPNTGLLLINALRQVGAHIKVALLPTGYGGDLEQAGPSALSSAQDVYFLSEWEPFEMHTASTERFQKYLKDAGVAGDPTFAEYAGYTSMLLLVQGLEAAGSNPTQAKLISALNSVHDFNADGLFGNESLNMSDHTALPNGPGECEYITKLTGLSFQLVPGADPICGTIIPGKTVSPPS